MSLAAGSRIGSYEIVGALGVGGMGEVYRARDTKLHRDVALKVLPDAFAGDSDRLARFQREAQLLASLNHPNIAAIYGLEERALVLELVEGPTLADRIAQGRIPIDEALPIARQIALGLEAAHDKGVIHRDLKPANIKLTPTGTVKILDFGLAKLLDREPARADAGRGAGATNSPTTTTPAMTMAGTILGTAAYMSPEQAKGREADKRSDVWAFGCVLYEMLTGARAFEGDDVSDTLAAVLRGTPEWSALPRNVPASVRLLIKRCVERDASKRIGDVAAPLFVLEDTAALEAPPGGSASQVRSGGSRRLMVVAASALAAGVVIGGVAMWWKTPEPPSRLTRTVVRTFGANALAVSGSGIDIAITPDGSRIVYSGGNNGTELFVRALDQLEPTMIGTGAGGNGNLFLSPNGQWVGFGGGTAAGLSKVAVSGGPPTRINFATDGRSRGATWADDDIVVFATDASSTGLQRMAATGGAITVLTRPDHARGEADHIWPDALPGGRAVLYTIIPAAGGIDGAQIAVLDLATGKSKILVRGGAHGRYAPSGHLLYSAGTTLRAVPFDVSRLETRGNAATVLPHLATTPLGATNFAMAADGTLVYVDAPTGAGGAGRTLVWVDRAGREQPLSAPPREYLHPRLSPDGTRVALWADDQESDIWIWDLARGTLTRSTFAPGVDNFPLWTPDGRNLIFGSNRSGAVNLFRQAADGTGTAERLLESGNVQLGSGVSPDGRWALFTENTEKNDFDVMMVRLDGDPGQKREVRPLVHSEFSERNGVVSPDGRWLAYDSDASGKFEVYVRPFPNTGDGQWQVSTSGGSRSLWARNGRELFYLAGDGSLTAVTVDSSGASWKAGLPRKILDHKYFTGGVATMGRTYDVSPDGQRFLMLKQADDNQPIQQQLVVVQHFDQELKRLVPNK